MDLEGPTTILMDFTWRVRIVVKHNGQQIASQRMVSPALSLNMVGVG